MFSILFFVMETVVSIFCRSAPLPQNSDSPAIKIIYSTYTRQQNRFLDLSQILHNIKIVSSTVHAFFTFFLRRHVPLNEKRGFHSLEDISPRMQKPLISSLSSVFPYVFLDRKTTVSTCFVAGNMSTGKILSNSYCHFRTLRFLSKFFG